MAYQVLLGGMLFPVAPQKIEVKIPSGNETIELIDGSQMNILKIPELSDISFSVELPGMAGRSYAVYENGFQPPGYYLKRLQQMVLAREAVQLRIVRALPNGTSLHNDKLDVSIEDYAITDDTKEGFDTTLKLSLKKHTQRSTYTASLTAALDGSMIMSVQKQRPVPVSAPVLTATTVTVLAGDTLWSIAKRYLGDGAKFRELAALNGIANRDVTAGQCIQVR